jgi:hypothetical protein
VHGGELTGAATMAVAASKYGNSGGPPTSGSDTRKTGEGFGIARACRWGESGGGEERVSSDGVAPFLNQCSGRGEEGGSYARGATR